MYVYIIIIIIIIIIEREREREREWGTNWHNEFAFFGHYIFGYYDDDRNERKCIHLPVVHLSLSLSLSLALILPYCRAILAYNKIYVCPLRVDLCGFITSLFHD